MGAPLPADENKKPPERLIYLYNHFLECRRKQPISYQEIQAFSTLMKCNFKPWEVSVIINIDSILEAVNNG